MPIFRYRAVTPSGEISTGEFDAASESDIVERLREQGLMPMQIAQASDGFPGAASSGAARGPRRRLFQSKRVSRDQVLAELTRQLPQNVDQMTPKGRVPSEREAEQWM